MNVISKNTIYESTRVSSCPLKCSLPVFLVGAALSWVRLFAWVLSHMHKLGSHNLTVEQIAIKNGSVGYKDAVGDLLRHANHLLCFQTPHVMHSVRSKFQHRYSAPVKDFDLGEPRITKQP